MERRLRDNRSPGRMLTDEERTKRINKKLGGQSLETKIGLGFVALAFGTAVLITWGDDIAHAIYNLGNSGEDNSHGIENYWLDINGSRVLQYEPHRIFLAAQEGGENSIDYTDNQTRELLLKINAGCVRESDLPPVRSKDHLKLIEIKTSQPNCVDILRIEQSRSASQE